MGFSTLKTFFVLPTRTHSACQSSDIADPNTEEFKRQYPYMYWEGQKVKARIKRRGGATPSQFGSITMVMAGASEGRRNWGKEKRREFEGTKRWGGTAKGSLYEGKLAAG